jgi:ribosome-associated protein
LKKKLTPLSLARTAGRLALAKKGFDVRILKLKDLSSVCDYFVIASGEADVQVRAIAGDIYNELAKMGHKPTYREGHREGNWVLLDYIDVVVHVFYEPTRRFYALEKLWGDAPVEELTED